MAWFSPSCERDSHHDSKTPISDVFQGRASLRYKCSKYLWYLLRFVPCNHALKTRHKRMLLNRDGYSRDELAAMRRL
jgi:hypothetical protein